MKSYLEFEHDIKVLEEELEKLKDPFNEEGITEVDTKKIAQIQREIDEKLKTSYVNLDQWQRTLIARHDDRPKAKFFIENLFTDFIILSGDRRFAEDSAIIAGFGLFEGKSVLVIGQEKGHDLDSRLKRNFGMVRPEGYRKAIRLMKLADKFNIPVIVFIDTSGAYPGVGSEKRGIAEAIASSIECCLSLKVPIIACIIGEGGSGGAIALASANKVLMLENAIYSVISPEGAAEIIFKDPTKKEQAAKSLKLTAKELLKLGVIDEIVQEPIAAHRNKEQVISSIKSTLIRHLEEFKNYTREEIYEQRKKKFLDLGRQKSFTSFAKNLSSLVEKDNFFVLIKENCLKYKNKLIIVFLLFLVMGFIFIK